MRKTHVTDKHAVDHVITNSLKRTMHTVRKIQHIQVFSQSYIHKELHVITKGDLKRWFEETYI